MQTLSQFVSAVNKQQWPSAHACTATSADPQTFFAKHTLSPHPSDWTLVEAKPDQIAGRQLRRGLRDHQLPHQYVNLFTLTRQGYRWLIESFR